MSIGSEKMAMAMYEQYLASLVRKKRDFLLHVTNYTCMIKEDGRGVVMFANDFKDTNYFLLPLINKIRTDGRRYLENNSIANDGRVDYSGLLDNPMKPKMICKVDVNGAYWNCGVDMTVISEETNEYCDKIHEGSTYKELKGTRLKAFGSLATRKTIYKFEEGREIKKDRIDKIEATRDLYIDICRTIDMLMKRCADEIEGCVYYYVDCMFVDKTFSEDVVEWFKERGYGCSVKETSLSYELIGDHAYLISEADGKEYLVRKEDRHLLVDC